MAINMMLNSGNKQNQQKPNQYPGGSGGGLGGIASSLLGGSSHSGGGQGSSGGLGALGGLLGGSSHNKPYGQQGQQMSNQQYGGGAPGQHAGGSGGLSGIFNAVTVSRLYDTRLTCILTPS